MRIKTVAFIAAVTCLTATAFVDDQTTAYAPTTASADVIPLNGGGYTGQDLLTQLRIAPEDTIPYTPDAWDNDQPPGCAVRVEVLSGFGTGTMQDNVCADPTCPAAPCWISNYDNVFTADPRLLVLDRRVSAQEANRSGAAAWTPEHRTAYLDDIENFAPTTAATAHAHNGRDAAGWQPVPAWQCLYAMPYAETKIDWKLSVDQAEFNALAAMLATCP